MYYDQLIKSNALYFQTHVMLVNNVTVNIYTHNTATNYYKLVTVTC